jgi:hypothetical protein
MARDRAPRPTRLLSPLTVGMLQNSVARRTIAIAAVHGLTLLTLARPPHAQPATGGVAP